jgi:hypothetical protein
MTTTSPPDQAPPSPPSPPPHQHGYDFNSPDPDEGELHSIARGTKIFIKEISRHVFILIIADEVKEKFTIALHYFLSLPFR